MILECVTVQGNDDGVEDDEVQAITPDFISAKNKRDLLKNYIHEYI
jgi:hypothetical protein